MIQNAKADIPPESFALILVNNTPEDKADDLWEFISAEDCVETIISLEPAANEFKQWFVDLRKAVIDLMSDPEPEIDHSDKENNDLQDAENGSNIEGSQTVADDNEGPGPGESASDGKSDGNTSSDT